MNSLTWASVAGCQNWFCFLAGQVYDRQGPFQLFDPAAEVFAEIKREFEHAGIISSNLIDFPI
jgi:hypothetical protein